MSQIILKNDKISLGILPDCGGSLSFFKYLEQDVLRATNESETNANQSSMFIMMPYTSFISDGKFPFFGITRSVPVNSNICQYPIHGDVWKQKTSLIHQDESSV